MVKVFRLEDNQYAIVITFMNNATPQANVTSYCSNERFNTLESVNITSRNTFDPSNPKAKTKQRYERPIYYSSNGRAIFGAIKQASKTIAIQFSMWAADQRLYKEGKAESHE